MTARVERAVQPSLLPDGADRPLGSIVGSVISGCNADLIAKLAPLYLNGSVCDLTYGRGAWWRQYRPADLVAHDLDPSKGDGVDFTALPEADATYDAVTFDPPYIETVGSSSSTRQDFRDEFGLTDRSSTELWALIGAGLAEAARVTRPGGFVLVKCMDYTKARLVLGHVRVLELAAGLGLVVHDLIVHHTGPGPGGHQTFVVKRARRHHSYLLVFRKGKR